MNPSPASIGMAMIGFALIVPAMAMRSAGAPLTVVNTFAAAFLLLGGGALLLRRPASFWVGMAGGLITALSAAVGMALHREVGLPISPVVGLVIGLYASFRVLIARSALAPAQQRRSIADELASELAADNRPPAPAPATPPEPPKAS